MMQPIPIPTPAQGRLFGAVAIGTVALLMPYFARAAAIPVRGENWFWDYVPSVWAVALASSANAVHAATLVVLANSTGYSRLAYWVAAVLSLIYVAATHFAYFDLRSSSTAGIGVLFVPI